MMEYDVPDWVPFFSAMGAMAATVFTAIGAAYGTAKSGMGISAMAIMKPEMIWKSIVPVVMAGIIAIYGIVVAILIAQEIPMIPTTTGNAEDRRKAVAKGFVHLAAGLAVGMSGMAAGWAVGIVGDDGVRANALQPKFYVGLILILIFGGVPALYGLITALAMMYV